MTFPDPKLEAAIRGAIDKPTGPICPSDLDGLTYLNAKEKNITDLTGLEYVTTLTNLVLGNNTISDISALANLTNLEQLSLVWNQISDISPLASLTNLQQQLDLGVNLISDISPLVDNEGLSEADGINLAGNPLSSDSINIYIPQLEARGVYVSYQNSDYTQKIGVKLFGTGCYQLAFCEQNRILGVFT